MNRTRWAFLPALALLAAGCGQAEPPADIATTTPTPAAKPVVAKIPIADVKLSDEEIAEIKKLPDPADQEAALAQKVCAVGEDDGKPNHLGAMGPPIKKEVKGKTIFLCCGGCESDLKGDPDKALARVGK